MIKTVIFDFDGVLADTEELHFRGLKEVLTREGLDITRPTYDDRYLALDDKGCFTQAFTEAGLELSSKKLEELVKLKRKLLEESLTKVKLFQGASEWIHKHSGVMPLAICSGALRDEIVTVLLAHKLLNHFSVIVSAEDVQKGKPSPEGYLLTFQQLRQLSGKSQILSVSECLVIEDSVAGVEAAKSAGMYCVAITNSFTEEKLQKADFIFKSIEQLDLNKIQSCFDG